MAKKGILERLKEGVVLGDGGYLLELEKRGWVRPGPFTPEVAITHPEALARIARRISRSWRGRPSGADVLRKPRQARDRRSRRQTRGHQQVGCARGSRSRGR